MLAAKELRSAGGPNAERHRDVPTKLKLLMQTIAGRFGYFIIKKATPDKLTNELAEAHARISSLEQRNSALQARFSRDKLNGGKQIR